VSAAPALPALEHCETCLCDRTSQRAVEYAKRVELIRLPIEVKQLAILTRPEAIADVLSWYKAHREAPGRARPQLTVVFVAHRDEIEVRVRETKVRTYRRRNVPKAQAVVEKS
jgi:hypothetical protein